LNILLFQAGFFLTWAFIHHHIQTGSGAHSATYLKGNESCFPSGKSSHRVKLTTASSVTVKNAQSYTSTPTWHGA